MDRVVVGKKGNWMGFVLVSREKKNCRTEKRKDGGRGKGSKDVRRGRREREETKLREKKSKLYS